MRVCTYLFFYILGRGEKDMVYFIVLVIIAVFCAMCISIVPQTQAYIIERLGEYKDTWQSGLHFRVPFIDKVAKKVDLKEQAVDFPQQSIITKDNITMKIDIVIIFQITDAKLYAYKVSNPVEAVGSLTFSTLMSIVRSLNMDEVPESIEYINIKMQELLNNAVRSWGIVIRRAEVKNIVPPKDITDLMENMLKAEYKRRELLDKSGNSQ